MRQRSRGLLIGGALAGALVSVGAAGPGAPGGSVLHVPRDYATIQTAVDAAEPGDTVLVAPGVYSEHVVVSTSGVRLQGSGADAVLDGSALGGLGIGVHVRGEAGALITAVEVLNIEVRNYERGISLEQATHLRVSHNYVHDNRDKATPAVLGEGFGIEVNTVFASDVSHNIISDNGFGGIRIGVGSTDNAVHHNRLIENGMQSAGRNGAGVFLTGPSNNNQVEWNEILRTNGRGVVITRPGSEAPITGILVAHNRLDGNQRAGVAIMGSATNNLVEYNDARGNNLANVGPCWRCNLFDNSSGRNGGNTFRQNHGTYGIPGSACASPQ